MCNEILTVIDGNKTIYKIRNHIRTISKIELYSFSNLDWVLAANAKTSIFHRKKGLMTKLINAAYKDTIKNSNKKGIYLLVLMWEYNNMVFYEKLGFKFVKYCTVSDKPYAMMAKGSEDKSQLMKVNFK